MFLVSIFTSSLRESVGPINCSYQCCKYIGFSICGYVVFGASYTCCPCCNIPASIISCIPAVCCLCCLCCYENICYKGMRAKEYDQVSQKNELDSLHEHAESSIGCCFASCCCYCCFLEDCCTNCCENCFSIKLPTRLPPNPEEKYIEKQPEQQQEANKQNQDNNDGGGSKLQT